MDTQLNICRKCTFLVLFVKYLRKFSIVIKNKWCRNCTFKWCSIIGLKYVIIYYEKPKMNINMKYEYRIKCKE